MTRALRAIRPLEWAWLTFLGFVLVRAGPSSFLWWRELLGLRSRRVLVAAAGVAVIHLIREYRQSAWLPAQATTKRRFEFFGALAVLPLLLAAFVVVTTRGPLSEQPPAEAIPTLVTAFLQVLAFGFPTLALWLAVGLHLKQHRRFSVGVFANENVRALGRGLRDWAPLVLLLSGYAWMGAVTDTRDFPERDAIMASADRFLFFGADPLDLLQRITWRPLSEWLAFSYSFYAVLWPLCLAAIWLVGGRQAFRETGFAVGLAMIIAFVSYSLVPVKGPVLWRSFEVPLEFYYVGAIKEALMDRLRITYDCFPSMHTCASLLLAWGCYRHARPVFWAVLPMVASIPLACVYLRYHYVVDVLAGFALAAFVAWVSLRVIQPEAPAVLEPAQ